MIEKVKNIIIKLACRFDDLPDWSKKLIYYCIGTLVMQFLLSLRGEFGIDTLLYQFIGILIVELTKWSKSKAITLS